MLFYCVAALAAASGAFAKVALEMAPIIANQEPKNRCYKWYAEPEGYGSPSTVEKDGCINDEMYGMFTLGTFDWPLDRYQQSPGYNGYVDGTSGTPLTIGLTNNAKDYDCTGVEVNLAFDYPTSSLFANVSTLDITKFDEVIIEYDLYIKEATTNKSDCSCLQDGVSTCPGWWKTQLTTDLLFYQGTAKTFNVISIRHFDPQNNNASYFNLAGGHRYQYSDHQVAPVPGTRQHVVVDAKHIIESFSSQLCQGDDVAPITFRSIQFVSIATGGDMTVEISNVKAHAINYEPGTFTASAVPPGCTPSNCPVQPQDPKSSCANWVPPTTVQSSSSASSTIMVSSTGAPSLPPPAVTSTPFTNTTASFVTSKLPFSNTTVSVSATQSFSNATMTTQSTLKTIVSSTKSATSSEPVLACGARH